MTPRITRALAALDALVQANPQLRRPAARRRLAAALASVRSNAHTSEHADAPTGRTEGGST